MLKKDCQSCGDTLVADEQDHCLWCSYLEFVPKINAGEECGYCSKWKDKEGYKPFVCGLCGEYIEVGK